MATVSELEAKVATMTIPIIGMKLVDAAVFHALNVAARR